MTRFFHTLVIFLFLLCANGVAAQIACPFAIPQETDVHSVWETAPLLLVNSNNNSTNLDPETQSNLDLLKFVYLNFRAPKIDPHEYWDGLIVVTFIIDAGGNVDPEQVRCIRTPHAALGQEAERVIRLMAELGMRWQPATIAGEAVSVRFNVPIRLRLE